MIIKTAQILLHMLELEIEREIRTTYVYDVSWPCSWSYRCYLWPARNSQLFCLCV